MAEDPKAIYDAKDVEPVVLYGKRASGQGTVYPILTDAYGSLLTANGLSLPSWDYMSLGISSETETYTFKTGGSGGSTVATVTIVYTDSGRTDILTVTKT